MEDEVEAEQPAAKAGETEVEDEGPAEDDSQDITTSQDHLDTEEDVGTAQGEHDAPPAPTDAAHEIEEKGVGEEDLAGAGAGNGSWEVVGLA